MRGANQFIKGAVRWGTVWGVLFCALWAAGQDRCFPGETAAELSATGSVGSLHTQRAALREQLAERPALLTTIPSRNLGFHSALRLVDSEEPVGWVELDLPKPCELRSVAMVPAFNVVEGCGSYAFPARFMVELSNTVMKTSCVLVDWREADFQTQGLSPIVFSSDEWGRGDVIRLTVTKGAVTHGAAYFALGEWLLFGRDADGEPIHNLLQNPEAKVRSSGSFTVRSLWSRRCLFDEEMALGLPLGRRVEEAPRDVELAMPAFELMEAEPLQAVMDLGETQQVDFVELYPGQAPDGLGVPMYGVPRLLQVALADSPEFEAVVAAGDYEARAVAEQERVRVKLGGRGRYLRLTFDQLPVYQRKAVVALGEVVVVGEGALLSAGLPVELSKGTLSEPLELTVLTDGVCRGREVLPMQEWLSRLAARRVLEGQLASVEARLEARRSVWQLAWKMGLSGLLVGALFVGGGVIFLRHDRRENELLQQRRLVARELHDDVGNSLGEIAAATEQLLADSSADGLRTPLEEICYTANDAAHSLTEAIWVSDYGMVSLEDLLYRFREHAWRVLPEVEVDLVIMGILPTEPLEPLVKRQLNSIYKAVLHNCVKHAQCKNIRLECSFHSGLLRIVILDDGVGFEVETTPDGEGFKSLRERADELEGHLRIESTVGHGTTIAIEVPYTEKR